MEQYLESLKEDPKYMILGYMIDQLNIILIVREITEAQKEIPKIIDGREVKIVRPI